MPVEIPGIGGNQEVNGSEGWLVRIIPPEDGNVEPPSESVLAGLVDDTGFDAVGIEMLSEFGVPVEIPGIGGNQEVNVS